MFVTIFTNFAQFYRSDKVVYAKQNGGKFNFIIEEKSRKAVPVDQVSAIIMLTHLSHRLLRSKLFHQIFC